MITISAEAFFDSAHFLSGYPGKCANLHGHRWKVVAEVSAPDVGETGMVMDFKDLKGALRAMADDMDHSLIMEEGSLRPATLQARREENFRIVMVPFRPTAENLARYFFEKLAPEIPGLIRVSVYETPENRATYEVTA